MTTIPMVNHDTGKTADVHPDEVATWSRHGWRAMDSDAPKSPPKIAPAPEIPANWPNLHWKQRIVLARELTGRDMELADADAAISAALDARGAGA